MCSTEWPCFTFARVEVCLDVVLSSGEEYRWVHEEVSSELAASTFTQSCRLALPTSSITCVQVDQQSFPVSSIEIRYNLSMLQIQRRCIQQRPTTLKETIHRRLIKPTSRPSTLDRTHTRPNTTTTNMPLVVPGLQSKDGDKSSNWMEKLVGKKIGDSSNETVRLPMTIFPAWSYPRLTRIGRRSQRRIFPSNTVSSR